MIAELFPWTDAALDRKIAARQAWLEADMIAELRWRWQAACERPALQLSHGVTTAGGGFGPGRAPLIREIELGSVDDDRPCTFVVELRPGQIVADLEDASRELAGALLAHRLSFAPIVGTPLVRVTIIEDDPHAEVIDVVDTVPGMLTLGPDENGEPVAFAVAALPHVAMQGTSGLGKSTAIYHLLRQVVRMRGVRMAGIDPSGVLFRPLPPDPWRVSGLGDVDAIEAALSSLVAEMDDRLTRLPDDDDKLPCGPGCPDPWVTIWLEELPGLLSAVEAIATAAVAKRVRAHIARLAAEGRKTGMRVFMIAQRFDATSTAGANVRNNAGLKISFAVENKSAVDFLHEGAPPDLVAEHLHAPPGVALVTRPGRPVTRVRFPLVHYRDWSHVARLWTPTTTAREEVPAA
jgi:DNA segregation ATPase FtsK/SpoIIIE-like protein